MSEVVAELPSEVVVPEGGEAPAQNTAESVPAAVPEGDKPAEAPTEDPTGKRESRRFERRIAAAYRREAEARAQAELYKRQYEEATKQRTETDPTAPKLADFNYDEEKYREAVEKHASEKTRREESQKRAAETAKAEQQRITKDWTKKVSAVGEKYPDFSAITADIELSVPALYAMMEADNGPDIAYYLGTNPDEEEAISNLSVPAQIRAIGRLEAKLAAIPPKPKTPSKAPAPINPLGGSAAKASDEISDEDDMKTFIRKRNKQLGR